MLLRWVTGEEVLMPLTRLLGLAVVLLTLAAGPNSCTIASGSVDDFQDGTTQGWRSGSANPNPPTWQPSGGPDGAGDGYLRIEGTGTAGSGGNLVAFNTAQWTGDYTRAGVVAIGAELRNLGESELVIRLLVEGRGGSFVTAAAARLPVGDGWRRVVWPLAPFSSGRDAADVLAQVTKLRILHAPTAESEPVAGVLGVDDVTSLTGDVCLDAGLARGELALCRVYCAKLDCRGTPRRGRSCDAIAARFERRNGQPPPCALDADGDGWLDAVDSCPDDPDRSLADRDGDGVGDVCDVCPDTPHPDQNDVCTCPCFDALDLETLLETLTDASTYQDLACVDDRPNVKPLTFVSARRIDGAPCGSTSEDCSAIAAEFTEDNSCQLNPPAPGLSVVEGEITDVQRAACRELILAAADAAALVCN